MANWTGKLISINNPSTIYLMYGKPTVLLEQMSQHRYGWSKDLHFAAHETTPKAGCNL